MDEMVLDIDWLTDGEEDYPMIQLFPEMNTETLGYSLNIHYTLRIDNLVANADQPLIPLTHRVILVYGALADWFSVQRNEASQQIWEGKWRDELKSMEGDVDETDDTAEIMVPDRWRHRSSSYIPSKVDLGIFFDQLKFPRY